MSCVAVFIGFTVDKNFLVTHFQQITWDTDHSLNKIALLVFRIFKDDDIATLRLFREKDYVIE